jgi:hypothetical protein
MTARPAGKDLEGDHPLAELGEFAEQELPPSARAAHPELLGPDRQEDGPAKGAEPGTNAAWTRLDSLICLVLLASIAGVFWQVKGHEFITYDDPNYVTSNLRVQSGLSPANVAWAFRTMSESNWHPLTWLSHMLDCQLFGLNAGAHHLVNVFFHGLNSLLLFAVLKKMTGTRWRSAFVAALFALHPLHVESVDRDAGGVGQQSRHRDRRLPREVVFRKLPADENGVDGGVERNLPVLGEAQGHHRGDRRVLRAANPHPEAWRHLCRAEPVWRHGRWRGLSRRTVSPGHPLPVAA